MDWKTCCAELNTCIGKAAKEWVLFGTIEDIKRFYVVLWEGTHNAIGVSVGQTSLVSGQGKGLVTNYVEWGGGLQNGRGGACEVLPLRKGGGGKSFSHAEEGAQKVLG